MAWQQLYPNAQLTKFLIWQLVALIQRDQVQVLALRDQANGDPAGTLPQIAEFQLAAMPANAYPVIVVTPMHDLFDIEATGSLHHAPTVAIVIAANHQNPNRCADLVQDYVWTVRAIIDGEPLCDYQIPLTLSLPHFPSGRIITPGLPVGTLSKVFTTDHDFMEFRRTKTGFATGVTLTVTCELEES
jgi:hypothetical protein